MAVRPLFCNFAVRMCRKTQIRKQFLIMGIYINKGNNAFREIRNSEYVDKSGLIAVVNKTLRTEQKFSCVTRSRRFGKSMAAKMLAAYFSPPLGMPLNKGIVKETTDVGVESDTSKEKSSYLCRRESDITGGK